MEKVLNGNGDRLPSNEKRIAIIKAVLESGNSIELPAMGFSMFPNLLPDDIIRVESINNNELPVIGSVVVINSNNTLIMHRLIKINISDSVKPELITQGDSLIFPDKAWSLKQLAGVAVSFRRNGNERKIKTRVLGELRYLYNKRLLWFYTRLAKVRHLR